MRIFFAGCMGGEFRNKKLKKEIENRRLVSYHYMNKGLDKLYFNKKQKAKKEK